MRPASTAPAQQPASQALSVRSLPERGPPVRELARTQPVIRASKENLVQSRHTALTIAVAIDGPVRRCLNNPEITSAKGTKSSKASPHASGHYPPTPEPATPTP